MPETEDKPDLDELLELLGEPDEAPRRKRIPGSVWLMLALVLSLAGIWLALRTAMGTAAAKTAGPPVLPTKVGDRMPREVHAEAADVVEDYLARCRKGMTAREVRWIVEDFQKAGLDDGPGSFRAIIETIFEPLDVAGADLQELGELSIDPGTAAKLRTLGLEWAFRQQRWYTDALADGLRLSSQQKLDLKASGRRFVRECEEDFLKIEDAVADANIGGPGRSYLKNRVLHRRSGADLLFPGKGLLEPSYWLERPDSAASERVRLSPGQLEIIRLQEEFSLVTNPKFPADSDDIVGFAKAMHPAQLKLLLLLDPGAAAELADALEKSNE